MAYVIKAIEMLITTMAQFFFQAGFIHFFIGTQVHNKNNQKKKGYEHWGGGLGSS